MPDADVRSSPLPGDHTVQEQLERAARDLWTTIQETGEDFVVFMDRRRLCTRVQQMSNGRYQLTWEQEDGSWIAYQREFDNPREAAFHGYQGPH
jgi:hypothetical protein